MIVLCLRTMNTTNVSEVADDSTLQLNIVENGFFALLEIVRQHFAGDVVKIITDGCEVKLIWTQQFSKKLLKSVDTQDCSEEHCGDCVEHVFQPSAQSTTYLVTSLILADVQHNSGRLKMKDIDRSID